MSLQDLLVEDCDSDEGHIYCPVSEKSIIQVIIRRAKKDFNLKNQLNQMGFKRFLHFEKIIGDYGDVNDRLVSLMGTCEDLSMVPLMLTYVYCVTHLRINSINDYLSLNNLEELCDLRVPLIKNNPNPEGFMNLNKVRRKNIRDMRRDRNDSHLKSYQIIDRFDRLDKRRTRGVGKEYNESLDETDTLNLGIEMIVDALEHCKAISS